MTVPRVSSNASHEAGVRVWRGDGSVRCRGRAAAPHTPIKSFAQPSLSWNMIQFSKGPLA